MSREVNKQHSPRDLEELKSLFTTSDTFVIVLYQANSCEPSSFLKQKLIKEHKNKPTFQLALVDVQQAELDLSEQFKVQLIPKTIVLEGSVDKIVMDFEGADQKQLSIALQMTRRY